MLRGRTRPPTRVAFREYNDGHTQLDSHGLEHREAARDARAGVQVIEHIEGSALQWRNLLLLALAELLGLTLWFSSSAVTPSIQRDWGLTDASTAWLVMAVQIGFVIGTLLSGLLTLPDIVDSRKLFAAAAALGTLSNAGFALLADGLAMGIAFRLLTGFFLAGVYPPGMKLCAT